MVRHYYSPDYNYLFNMETGVHLRWGVTEEQDALYAPFPEIADIEVSTTCHGVKGKPCPHCYKSNTGKGKNMPLRVIQSLLDSIPQELTQVALGVGDSKANPDLLAIMDECRHRNIIPNITINGDGLDDQEAADLASRCGGIAVSNYDKQTCYTAIARLRQAGASCLYIHQLLSEETLAACFQVLHDASQTSALTGLKAVVFLSLKEKGRGKSFTRIQAPDTYRQLFFLARQLKVGLGFDSCSAPVFLHEQQSQLKKLLPYVDCCEAGLFSIYINVDGEAFPCSFTEGTPDWETGLLVAGRDFSSEVWHHPRMESWREALLASPGNCPGCKVAPHCHRCPVYNLTPCFTPESS